MVCIFITAIRPLRKKNYILPPLFISAFAQGAQNAQPISFAHGTQHPAGMVWCLLKIIIFVGCKATCTDEYQANLHQTRIRVGRECVTPVHLSGIQHGNFRRKRRRRFNLVIPHDMKKLSILTSLAVLASATACTVKEQEVVLPVFPQYEEFYATIEQPSETTDTKTYADDQFRVLWHADDRITIFNKYTYNQQYAFQGETGDNAGGFSKVGDDDFVTGNDLPDIYAVYPYQKSTKISNDGVIAVTLPAEQTWADGSFGPGANTMISATSDNKLKATTASA